MLHSKHFHSARVIISADREWRLRAPPTASFTKPGVCARELYEGREGENGDGNGGGNGVGGGNRVGGGNGDGDGNSDGDRYGAETGTGEETKKRRKDGSGDGNDGGNERKNARRERGREREGGGEIELWYPSHQERSRVEDQALPFRTRHHLYTILCRQEVTPVGSQQLRAQDPAPARRCDTEGRTGHQGQK